MSKRIGFYCWAGPGTIRMTNLKFFNPTIDQDSLMHSYDYEYLAKAKEIFGITDVWATYSWGFSEEVEKKDYEFLASKRENFKKLGLKLHAYIQGPTLVYSDFPDVDWYCIDTLGRHIWYHRGRKMVCINNLGFVNFVVNKIKKTKKYGFDGIYIDNIVMGQLPLPVFTEKLPFVFAGCFCSYCKDKYFKDRGLQIPVDFEKDQELTKQYLLWRTQCVTNFLKRLAEETHKLGMLFGSNSYDPRFSPKYSYGIDSKALDLFQDYHLFESLSFPSKNGLKDNKCIERLAKTLKKPVFVVSYKYAIGIDSEYKPSDWDVVYSEELKEKIHIAIKGSEYFTKGAWHNLRFEHLRKPNSNLPYPRNRKRKSLRKVRNIILLKPVRQVLKVIYNPSVRLIMENKIIRSISNLVAHTVMFISRTAKRPDEWRRFASIGMMIIVASLLYHYFLSTEAFHSILVTVQKNRILAVGLLLTIKVIGLVWPPLSGGIVTYSFIPLLGFFTTYFIDFMGTIFGVTITYFISKIFGRQILLSFLGKNLLSKIENVKISKDRELEAVVVASALLAGISIEIVSYAAGLLKVNYFKVLFGTLVGYFLWTIPTFFLASSFIYGTGRAISLVFIVIFLIIFLKIKKRYM